MLVSTILKQVQSRGFGKKEIVIHIIISYLEVFLLYFLPELNPLNFESAFNFAITYLEINGGVCHWEPQTQGGKKWIIWPFFVFGIWDPIFQCISNKISSTIAIYFSMPIVVLNGSVTMILIFLCHKPLEDIVKNSDNSNKLLEREAYKYLNYLTLHKPNSKITQKREREDTSV